jgi:glycine/D-amino acid oxidase-like deaminating enzyme
MPSSAVVVGAGVFGASIAHRLAADGWTVTLVEREEPAGPRSTSGSHSRVLRCGHGEDAWHARLAWRARTLWQEIERDTGVPLFVKCGVLWLARREDGWEAATESTLRAEGIPVERLDLERAASLYPSFSTEGLTFAVYEPEGGMLRARRGVQVLARLAAEHGARLVTGEATPVEDGAAVSVGGQVIEADRIVWACGPWLGRLFPGIAPVTVERAEYATFAAGPGWRADDGAPVFIEFDGDVYGLPSLDGEGFKVAPESPPEDYDPDTRERPLTDRAEDLARAYLARRFPALAVEPRTGGRVCQYEMTPDSEFVLAPLPDHSHVWIVGGGSGHGFKHGPALAEVVRDRLTGAEAPLPRHALGHRDPAPGLMFERPR